jgi:hypothetical protein
LRQVKVRIFKADLRAAHKSLHAPAKRLPTCEADLRAALPDVTPADTGALRPTQSIKLPAFATNNLLHD